MSSRISQVRVENTNQMKQEAVQSIIKLQQNNVILNGHSGALEFEKVLLAIEVERLTGIVKRHEQQYKVVSEQVDYIQEELVREIALWKNRLAEAEDKRELNEHLEKSFNAQLKELHQKHSEELNMYASKADAAIEELHNRKAVDAAREKLLEATNSQIKKLGEELVLARSDVQLAQKRIQEMNAERERQAELSSVQLNNTIEQLKKTYENEVQLVKKQLETAQEAAIVEVKESTSLKNRNQHLEIQLEELRKQFEDAQDEWQTIEDDLTEQIETYKASLMGPQEQFIRFEAEKSQLQIEIKKLKDQIQDLNLSISGLKEDNEKLRELTQSQLADLEKLREERKSIMGGGGVLGGGNLEKMKRDFEELQDKNLSLLAEKNMMAAKIRGLEAELEITQQTVAETQSVMQTRKSEQRQLEEEIQALRLSLSEMEANKKVQGNEITSLREKIKAIMNELESALKERDNIRQMMERNESGHADLNAQLLERIRQVDEVKNRYDNAMKSFEHKNSITKKTTLTKRSVREGGLRSGTTTPPSEPATNDQSF